MHSVCNQQATVACYLGFHLVGVPPQASLFHYRGPYQSNAAVTLALIKPPEPVAQIWFRPLVIP
ncbi:hypothetical protein EMIT0324P_11353 [Pseudomonas chlororaphis]